MSFRFASLLSLGWLLAACTPAVEDAAGSRPDGAPVAAFDRSDADPAVWKVSDADTTIYLFGTIHLLKPDILWFDDEVASAFAAADELVLEAVDPPPAEMQAIMTRGVARDGIKLRDRLDQPHRAALEAALADLDQSPAAFDVYEPWMAAILFSVLPAQKLGYDPNSGVDKGLARHAVAAKKPISGVETIAEQIGFFDTLAMADQIAFLNATVAQLPDEAEGLERMERDWATADTDDLAALLNEGLDATPQIGRLLLYDRNARWADWIARRRNRPEYDTAIRLVMYPPLEMPLANSLSPSSGPRSPAFTAAKSAIINAWSSELSQLDEKPTMFVSQYVAPSSRVSGVTTASPAASKARTTSVSLYPPKSSPSLDCHMASAL